MNFLKEIIFFNNSWYNNYHILKCNISLHMLSQAFQANNQVSPHSYLAADTLKAILTATGKPFDEKEVNAVVDKLKGKNVEEVQLSINTAY